MEATYHFNDTLTKPIPDRQELDCRESGIFYGSKELGLLWSFKIVIINSISLLFVLMVILSTTQSFDPFRNGLILVNKELDCSDTSYPVQCNNTWECVKRICQLNSASAAFTSVRLVQPSHCDQQSNSFTLDKSPPAPTWQEIFFVAATALSILHCLMLVVYEFSWVLTSWVPPTKSPIDTHISNISSYVLLYIVLVLLLLTRLALFMSFFLTYDALAKRERLGQTDGLMVFSNVKMLYVVILVTATFLIDTVFDVFMVVSNPR
jgi:hypothetical protein